MGACEFFEVVKGKNASEAFSKAVEQAKYDHGHSGYTGSIAEKHTFKMIKCPKDQTPEDYAQELLEKDELWICDKWGPAGCIKIEDGKYLFFGLASS